MLNETQADTKVRLEMILFYHDKWVTKDKIQFKTGL